MAKEIWLPAEAASVEICGLAALSEMAENLRIGDRTLSTDQPLESDIDYGRQAARRADALLHSFTPSSRTLANLLVEQARKYGDRPLFKSGGKTISFAEAPDAASKWAATLSALGIRAGDRVAIICGNRPEFMDLLLGTAWLGATMVPINTASRGFQLQHILSNSGAKVLFIDPELVGSLAGLDKAASALERVFVVGGLPVDGVEGMPEPAGSIASHETMPSDIFAILYTSGTTGISKGVCCPHAQMFLWGVYTSRQLGVGEGDILNTTLPLFHTNAINCFFQALVNGATHVLEPRFSVSKFYDRLRVSEATVTYLLGSMVPMLLSRPASANERDHAVRIALAPGVPAQYHAEFKARTGITLLDGFGSTESNAVIGTELSTQKPGKMGKLASGFQARVVDDNDVEVPVGQAGELVLRADEPFAFASGYYGMPEKTVEAWRNLWLHTGDRVLKSEDGYYQFLDRMKDTIRRRGENISSYEVEQVVLSHPSVVMAAAFPVSSDLADDEVMVSIILKDETVLDFVELIRHCETRMPYFAVPRFIDVVPDLPRTANGKVQKFILKERGVTETAWDREAEGVAVKR